MVRDQQIDGFTQYGPTEIFDRHSSSYDTTLSRLIAVGARHIKQQTETDNVI